MKKTGVFILFLFFLLATFGNAADQGKIVVAAEGKTTASKVSGVAARAPYFLFFDRSGKMLEAVANPYKSVKGGAGTSVVHFLSQRGATLIAAGEFGKNMFQAMKNKGLKSLEVRGSVEEALKQILEK
jgi:predicted Fe-Mo cluster-binding NifX family protein